MHQISSTLTPAVCVSSVNQLVVLLHCKASAAQRPFLRTLLSLNQVAYAKTTSRGRLARESCQRRRELLLALVYATVWSLMKILPFESSLDGIATSQGYVTGAS